MKNKFNPLLKSNIQKVPDSLTDIDTRSHTSLSDIGTNTHAQIDTALGTTIPATYVPYTGATGDVDLGANKLTLDGGCDVTGGDFTLYPSGVFAVRGATELAFIKDQTQWLENIGLSATQMGKLAIYNGDTNQTTGLLDFSALATGNKTFTFPNRTGNVLVDGADIDIGAYELRAQTLESDVATGTAPLTIASTTKVTNLNSDLLDGLHDTSFAKVTSAGTITVGSGKDYTTIQGAIDSINGMVTGNIIIDIDAGTYREDVDINGKNFSGPYSITLQGKTSDNDTGTATSGANLAGNGSAGWGTITNTNKNYTADAKINNWIEITSGTGSGQRRLIYDNTATVITVVGRWDTVPNNTSAYRIFTLTTIITGANAGAETTNVRKYVVKVYGGQKGINLKYLKLVYGGLVTWDSNLLVDGGSECNCTACYFQGGWYWQCLYLASSTGYFDECLWYNNAVASIGDIRAGGGSFISRVYRCKLEGNGNRAINPSFLGSITGVKQTYIYNTPIGLYADALGCLETDAYLEIDSCTANNIWSDIMAVVFINAQEGATTTQVSKNSAGWGAKAATTGALIVGASAITYSGNALGTYTPTTALAAQTT